MTPFTTVLVTYADRGHLLKQVVSSVVSSGCDNIIIIDNGSHESSKKIINSMPVNYSDIKFTIHKNEKNEGSAIAFGIGMDLASSNENKNEIVLFLDDDNLPKDGAIQDAIKFSLSDNENKNVYFLLREDRPHYIEFVRTKNQDVLLGEKNSFMSFTLKKYLKSIVNKLNKTEIQEKYDSFSDSCIQIPCGPYGGMLTKKSILSNGIRPFKDMVLYFDDTKYTYDLSLSGVKLFLLTKCFINDIDDSWSAVKTKKTSSPLFEAGEFKISHTIRNRVFFELYATTNNVPIYVINIFFFMLILFVKALTSHNMRTFLKISKYIIDGVRFYKEKAH